MTTKTLTRFGEKLPVIEDFFKSWNDWLGNGDSWTRTMNVPAVNITEEKNEFLVSLAVPGMKKDDFKIDVDRDMLTISCEREENKEEKEKKFTRREYSFTSFCRSFTLPEEVMEEKINAEYKDGLLKIHLPRKEDTRKTDTKHIPVN